jgi:hypothetical protein
VTSPNNGTISAGPADYKYNYCQKQAAGASIESILPLGSVVLGGNYRPTNVLSETGKEGVGQALDWASKFAPLAAASKFFKVAGVTLTLYNFYDALSAGQKKFAACME